MAYSTGVNYTVYIKLL